MGYISLGNKASYRATGVIVKVSVFQGSCLSFACTLDCYPLHCCCPTIQQLVAQVELQTSRQKVVLYDNTTSPLPFLGPGSRHDFIVQHDIKELGIHNLICSTVYTAADGERRYTPETFKFTSANPLYVKTKVSFESHVLIKCDLPYAAAPP